MPTTSLQPAAAAPPVAAAPSTPAVAPGDGAAQLVPSAGTSFVPISAGSPVPSSAVSPVPAAPAQAAGSAPATDGASGQQVQPKGIDAKQGLALLVKEFGENFSDPIIAANGSVYMEARKPELKDGKLVLRYELVARIDRESGRMLVNPKFLDSQKPARDPNAKLVKVEDKYFWQTPVTGEDGKTTATMVPVTDAELQSMAEQQKAQEAQQSLQAWNQDKVEWMRKLGTVSSLMKVGGYSGSLLQSIGEGPNPYTGKTGANWMTGYMVLQMLDGQAQGKLLPQWMKTGPTGIAMEWGLQGLFMLDMGRDLAVLAAKFPRAAAAMHAFTTPTRAVWQGVKSLGAGIAKATAPGAAAAGAAQAAAGAGQRVGLAAEAVQAATAAGQAVQGAGTNSAITAALKQLGGEFRDGTAAIVGAPGTQLADKVAIMNREGALQLVPKSSVYEATKLTTPALQGGAKVQAAITGGIHGALGAMRPFLRTLQVGGSIFGTIVGALNVAVTVKNSGAKSLITTRDGRGALFGLLGSAAFLGLMALPVMAPALGAGVTVAASALNVASNVFSGISMLNYAGLFGEGGWLDKDAARAAFLIPPLTPLGLAGLWFKHREKQAKQKAATMEENQKSAVAQVSQLRQTTAQQLQQAGTIAGSTENPDGSLLVATGVSNDLSQAPGAPETARGNPVGDAMNHTLRLLSRPMR